MEQYSESIVWMFLGSAAVTIILSIVLSLLWTARRNRSAVDQANKTLTSQESSISNEREKKEGFTLTIFIIGSLLVGAFCLLVYYGWLIVKLVDQLEK